MKTFDRPVVGRVKMRGLLRRLPLKAKAGLVAPDETLRLPSITPDDWIDSIARRTESTRFRRRTHAPEPSVEGSFRRRVAHGPPRAEA